MTTLKEQEDIDYLDRARNCLHHIDTIKDDYNIELLMFMLDAQSFFLRKLMGKNEMRDLAHVTLDATGFPEIKSWVVDVRRVVREYYPKKIDYLKSCVPLIQEFKNFSPEGILRYAESFEKFTHPADLSSWCLENVSEDILKGVLEWPGETPFFRTHPDEPGLLATELTTVNPYSERLVSKKCSFKYLDSKYEGTKRPPMIIIAGINTTLIKEVSIHDRRTYEKKDNEDYNQAINLERTLARVLREPFRNAFYKSDFTKLSDVEIDKYIESLKQLQDISTDLERFIDRAGNVQKEKVEGLNPQLLKKGFMDLAQRQQDVVRLIPTDELMIISQNAFAKSLASFEGKIGNSEARMLKISESLKPKRRFPW